MKPLASKTLNLKIMTKSSHQKIFKEEELSMFSVVKKSLTTAVDGKKI
jgi:hypothetical protein